MAYTAEISRSNPACVVILVDHSMSMAESLDGVLYKNKAEAVADAINRLLQALVLRCVKADSVRDYFFISVIGYGAEIGSAFNGVLAGRTNVPVSEIAENVERIDQRIERIPDDAGGLTDVPVSRPVWIEPISLGPTSMNSALGIAEDLVAAWVAEHPGSFPPLVLNLTDGESTDGDPLQSAISIQRHMTADGAALLFNLHTTAADRLPALYPDSDSALPNEHSQCLFRMSSLLPPYMRSYAESLGHQVSEGTRGFAYNADIASVVQFLDIGTQTTHLS